MEPLVRQCTRWLIKLRHDGRVPAIRAIVACRPTVSGQPPARILDRFLQITQADRAAVTHRPPPSPGIAYKRTGPDQGMMSPRWSLQMTRRATASKRPDRGTRLDGLGDIGRLCGLHQDWLFVGPINAAGNFIVWMRQPDHDRIAVRHRSFHGRGIETRWCVVRPPDSGAIRRDRLVLQHIASVASSIDLFCESLHCRLVRLLPSLGLRRHDAGRKRRRGRKLGDKRAGGGESCGGRDRDVLPARRIVVRHVHRLLRLLRRSP